jgi:hypothetical protein
MGAGFRKDGRCKRCLGTGSIQVAQGTSGVVHCPSCKGLGKKTEDVAPVGDSELKDFVIKVRRPQTTRAVELTFTAATPADASLAAKKQGFLLLSDPVLKRMANDAAFSAYGVVKDRRLLKEFATKAEAEKWAASEPGSKVTKITVPGRDVRPVGDASGSWKTVPHTAAYWGYGKYGDPKAPVPDDDFNTYEYLAGGEWLGQVSWNGKGKYEAQVMYVRGQRPDGQPLRSSKAKTFGTVAAAKAHVEANAAPTGSPHLYQKGTKHQFTKK